MRVCTYKERYKEINETNNKLIWGILSLLLLSAAVIRYFYRLDARMSFAVDEPQTFATAVGYLKTGTFYEWDFWNNKISDVEYYGLVPYIKILALWMKVFGISLVSARCLSAVFGCLFILSCIYIIKRLFNRIDITVISTIFILMHPEITYWFRFIRMYAMLMLCSIWFAYFAYMALTKGNHFKGNNIFVKFIEKNLNFNFIYAALALGACYLASRLQEIQMVMCGGMALFAFYKAISCKERKYKNVVWIGIIGIFLGVVGFVFSGIFDIFPIIYYFAGSLKYWVSIGAWNNTMYIWDNVNAVSNQLLMYLGWGMAVVSIFSKNKKEEKDCLIYLLFIQIVSVIFFTWFANHYYQSRYLCFILPISIIIFAYGFVMFMGRGWKKDTILFSILLIVANRSLYQGFDYVYTLWDTPASQKIYERVGDLFEGEEIDVLAVDFDMQLFGYFASQELESINYNRWENYDTEYSFEAVHDFAQEYPRGLVWIQATHLFNRREEQKRFLQEWTDRVAGKRIDNYNIEIGKLNYIKPGNWEKYEDLEIENFVTIEQGDNPKEYQLKLYGEILEQETKFVCIQLYLENENRVFHYQLEVPQIEEKNNNCYIYNIELDVDEDIKTKNCYALVDYGNLVEGIFEEN